MKILLVTQTRNKKGQAARSEQQIVADALRIGRGTDCKLFLPDPRVALHHAQIRHGTDGSNYIEADAGVISVDGSLNRAGKLQAGQRILIGPYEIIVLPAQPDVDLALSLELIEPLREGVEEVRSKVRAGLKNTWLSRRLFSWVAATMVLLAFIAWPVMHATSPDKSPERIENLKADITPDASWDVGPLASAHAGFGRDCGKCHQQPFVQVMNQACEDCHKTIGWHFPLRTPEAKAVHAAVFPDTRCASCHRDHKGPNGLVRTDATLCTDCHRDLKTRHAKSGLPDISDFSKDHPAFMLSILQPGRRGDAAIVRVPQEGKAAPRENSGLKFPHKTHLDKKGVRSPDGTVTLECSNCHLRDEAGIRFKPVTMKDHCQRCHSLEFEPKVTTRQVPHGKVGDVLATLNEFYAQAALADTPIDVVVEANIRRPGERLAETKRQAALTWAADKADRIAHDLFEVRVCFLCHQITPVVSDTNATTIATAVATLVAAPAADSRPASWTVAPVAVTQHWLPKSRFPHSQHETFECAKCHQVANSKTSADIAIPDLKNCRECHGGNQPSRDKARGTCETCHGFHTGSHKAGVPAIVPGGNLPKVTQAAPDATGGGAKK